MKKISLLVICFVMLLTGYVFAEKPFVGKIEKLEHSKNKIDFEIAVYDGDGVEVYRQGRGEATGGRPAEELRQYLIDLRETITQNAYAGSTNGKKFITNYKEELENSESLCGKFVPIKERKIK